MRTIEWGEGSSSRASGRAAAIVAMSPTLAGRIATRPALPGAPRPAHPAHPAGRRHQVPRRLRRAVLAPRRAHRPGGLGRRPGEGDLRQLAARRLARRPARVPRGRSRARARHVAGRPRRAAVIGTLARLFGPRAATPGAFYEQKWAAEEWTRGCYGPTCRRARGRRSARALRPPIGPLHWAGAEYAERWSGYMDGAVRSGEAAAAAVCGAPVCGQPGSRCHDNYRDQEPPPGGYRRVPDRARRDADGPVRADRPRSSRSARSTPRSTPGST